MNTRPDFQSWLSDIMIRNSQVMLKSQDVVLLLKLLSQSKEHLRWSQSQLALHLCISVSEVNAAIKRLGQSGLLRHMRDKGSLTGAPTGQLYLPVTKACEEFLISGVKYVFPAQLGEYTYGIATSYAAPVFENQIVLGQDPVPVWSFVEGKQRGLAIEPLYPSVPKSLTRYPDQVFYDLLALIDAIRQGRARERNMAIKLLKERLSK